MGVESHLYLLKCYETACMQFPCVLMMSTVKMVYRRSVIPVNGSTVILHEHILVSVAENKSAKQTVYL